MKILKTGLSSELSLKRESLLALAARHRSDRALSIEAGANWQCDRGHAWDDSISAAQNVRCMGCASQRREIQFERLQAVAAERGGRLLSAPGECAAALRWQCAFGHQWDATPEAVTKRWCHECLRQGAYDGGRKAEERAHPVHADISEPASLRQSQKS